MKATAAIAAATASLTLAMTLALSPAFGSEDHYLVRCADLTAGETLAIDARTIQGAGGKAHAIELFKQKHPGGRCSTAVPRNGR
jgi:hypothetical protein